jgi:hypothetical protein
VDLAIGSERGSKAQPYPKLLELDGNLRITRPAARLGDG